MHPEARDFVQRQVGRLSLLEFGSRDVNGGIRDLFTGWDYLGVDRVPGRGVDAVADAAMFDTPKRYDVVACCEAFEHAENWRAIVANAFRLLRPGGLFVGTAAGPDREPHNCDGTPHDGKEWYANIVPDELADELHAVGFRDGLIEHRGTDVRWSCRKPA